MKLTAGAGLLTFPDDLHGCKQGVFEPCQLAWLQIEPQNITDQTLLQRLHTHAGQPIEGLGSLSDNHASLLAECRDPRPDSAALMQDLLHVMLRRFIRIAEHEQPHKPMPDSIQAALHAIAEQPQRLWEVEELRQHRRYWSQSSTSIICHLRRRKPSNLRAASPPTPGARTTP